MSVSEKRFPRGRGKVRTMTMMMTIIKEERKSCKLLSRLNPVHRSAFFV